MAKKWPEKVIQRSFIKEHSFVNRLYVVPNLLTRIIRIIITQMPITPPRMSEINQKTCRPPLFLKVLKNHLKSVYKGMFLYK